MNVFYERFGKAAFRIFPILLGAVCAAFAIPAQTVVIPIWIIVALGGVAGGSFSMLVFYTLFP